MRKIFSIGSALKKMTPLLFIMLFLPLSAHAEILAGSVELSPFVGFNAFENRQNLHDMPVYGGRVGYNFTNQLGVEWTGEYIRSYVNDKNQTFNREGQFTSPTDGVNVTMYHLDLLYHFLPQGKFNPFVTAGYGAAFYSPSINSKNMSDVDFGVGVKYWVADNIALRLDVRDNLIVDDQISNIETTAGIVFRFGGKRAAAPTSVVMNESSPTPTPAPTPAPPAVVAETHLKTEDVVTPVVQVPASEPTPEKMKYCISLNIEYDINKSDIRPQYRDEVARVGDFLNKYPTTSAVIEGYSDEVGTDAYNMQLSQRRAESVVQYLVDNFGIVPTRLSARGYGKSRPIADNGTDAGKQKNRHIDAIIDCALDVKDLAPLPERLCMTLKVEFAADSAEIDPRYFGEVTKVGEYMKKYPTTTAVIEGHTDSVGDADFNLKLSQRRAESVVNFLVGKFGIERSRLTAKGYGSTRRVAYNNTAAGRQKNRRINAIIDCVIMK